MARPKGTKYIKTPEKMWELFCDYVEHERNNPMHRVDYVGRDGEKVLTPLEVPITFTGFECYVAEQDGMPTDLGHYVQNVDGRYTDYIPIITRIQKFCFSQNFKGASVGLFNANLIAKKLGLVDKQQIDVKSEPRVFKID